MAWEFVDVYWEYAEVDVWELGNKSVEAAVGWFEVTLVFAASPAFVEAVNKRLRAVVQSEVNSGGPL